MAHFTVRLSHQQEHVDWGWYGVWWGFSFSGCVRIWFKALKWMKNKLVFPTEMDEKRINTSHTNTSIISPVARKKVGWIKGQPWRLKIVREIRINAIWKQTRSQLLSQSFSRDSLCTDLTHRVFVLDNLKGSGPTDWQQHVWSDLRAQAWPKIHRSQGSDFSKHSL